MTRASTHALLGVFVTCLLVPAERVSARQAMGDDCRFEPGTELFERQAFATSTVISALRARIRCDGDVTLRADSLTYYEARGLAELTGNVFYSDTTRSLTAARATFYQDIGQLVANGDSSTYVVVTDLAEGSRLTGMNLNYLQAGGGRAEDEVTVFGRRPGGDRPRAILPVDPPEDAEPDAPAPTPFDVTANRIFIRGERFLEATGQVDVVRDSLVTFSDTLVYDEVTTTLDLRGRASLVQSGDSIAGRRVRVRLPENEIREIEAIGEGSLVSSDLDLESPWFRITFVEGEVDGLWAARLRGGAVGVGGDSLGVDSLAPGPAAGDTAAALPPALDRPPPERRLEPDEPVELSEADSLDLLQPVAVSGATRITADSLDVAATVGVLDSVRAIGRAYAVSSRDSIDASMLPEIARQDWIRGDTIVTTLRNRLEGDSTVYSIDRIVSAGSASSLYRLAPDTTSSAPDSAAVAGDSTAVTEAPPEDRPDPDAPPSDSIPSDSIPSDSIPAAGAADSTVLGLEDDPVVLLPASAPGVHYVVAERIILVFENDEVRRMEIFGLSEGVHLEPRRGGTAATAAPPAGGEGP